MLTIALTMLGALTSFAGNCNCDDWKEKMMVEKIGFLTMEMNLTVEEAERFWPVYHEAADMLDKAREKVFSAYSDLKKAVEENNEASLKNLLNAYLKAIDDEKAVHAKASEMFKNVIPVEKVAVLYVAEEKFRRQQIHRLHKDKPAENR